MGKQLIVQSMTLLFQRSVAFLAIFEPEVHLAPCAEPPSCIDMDGLRSGGVGIPEVAVSKPFPLFTVEVFALSTRRWQIMSSSIRSTLPLYGECVDHAPGFIKEVWTHPEVKRRIKEAAGVKFDIIFDYEIGHTNDQLGPRGWKGLKAKNDFPDTKSDLGTKEEIQPTLMVSSNWHKDSYPGSK
ncbi:hypothetical protein M422DRAFT_43416 [Sphaerobolus stellatus SS14]|nr:hypothetical protein M422DRAFT_43416 [Sphaerobolus stellatus SS14]